MQQSQFGIFLALIGALILTPDSLFMRLSQMDGGAMLAWRATLAGMVFLLIGLNKRSRRIDISTRIFSKSFLALIICQIANTSFFAFAISLAPVAIVLVAVATVPIISVILSALFLGERASLRSWGIILTVMLGIVISVTVIYTTILISICRP